MPLFPPGHYRYFFLRVSSCSLPFMLSSGRESLSALADPWCLPVSMISMFKMTIEVFGCIYFRRYVQAREP